MPLHRDIHWLGRQWAVTGHGLQLINQKQRGYYDIEAARLGEARVIEAMRSKAWIDGPDFDKALEVARAKFADVMPTDPAPAADPPRKVAPLPPAQVTPPAPSRAQLEPASVPTIEELLARLKTKSAFAVKSAEAPVAVAAPPGPDAQTIEAREPESPPSPPVDVVDRTCNPTARAGPAWPVFERKIAGSARFVSPWRVRSTRWHGPSSGLPPRP